MSDLPDIASPARKFDPLNVLPYAGLAVAGVAQLVWLTGLGYAAWLIARTAL